MGVRFVQYSTVHYGSVCDVVRVGGRYHDEVEMRWGMEFLFWECWVARVLGEDCGARGREGIKGRRSDMGGHEGEGRRTVDGCWGDGFLGLGFITVLLEIGK